MEWSREQALVPDAAALLVVDLQNFCAHRDGEEARDHLRRDAAGHAYFFGELPRVLDNVRALQDACRAAQIEVIFCVIENLTLDGRDRGLDYKITGFNVPKGSWGARVLEQIAPVGDEIVIGKTSSSVFNSTNIDFVLRALGTRQVVIVGSATDQCVEGAIRDACDIGYLVTMVTDACATYSPERQAGSERALRGYCRQVTTAELIAEIQGSIAT